MGVLEGDQRCVCVPRGGSNPAGCSQISQQAPCTQAGTALVAALSSAEISCHPTMSVWEA